MYRIGQVPYPWYNHYSRLRHLLIYQPGYLPEVRHIVLTNNRKYRHSQLR